MGLYRFKYQQLGENSPLCQPCTVQQPLSVLHKQSIIPALIIISSVHYRIEIGVPQIKTDIQIHN